MRRVWKVLLCVIISSWATADAQLYPGYMRQDTPVMKESIATHRYVKMNGIPAKYRDFRNPVAATEENLIGGAKVYGERCAPCHGESGRGGGPQGKDLDPPPSPLASSARMPVATDSYLFWAIADGGKELKTAMPAFRDVLGDEEIWKVVLYLRLRTWSAPGEK